MKTELMAFVVEIRESKNEENDFRFNETMVQAMLSGLSVVYTELFAWSVKKHFAIWVSGSNADHLIKSFHHHQAHLKNAHLLKGTEAERFFDDVVMGRSWSDCSMLGKLHSFNYGYELSQSVDGLGPCLLPMLQEGKRTMSISPFITGSRNSWTGTFPDNVQKAEKPVPFVKINSRDLFYRFSIN